MRLKILVPTGLRYEGEIRKVSAEAINGAFTMLPNHIGFTTALVPSILFFETAGENSEEVFFAVDKSILVKCGPDVLISTRNAVRSKDLKSLYQAIDEHFTELDEHERRAHSALVKMETYFVTHFLEIEGVNHE